MPAVFATLALILAAGPADPAPLALTAFWENDGFIKRNNAEDGHYTSGSMLLLSHDPAWADTLAAHAPGRDSFGATRTAGGYFVGQQIFTPDDTDAAAIIPGDRPYAGYLFAGAYWQRANADTLDHVQLEVGTLGDASLAEDAQNWVHGLIDDEPADGWDNQIADEITVQLTVRRKWRMGLLERDGWGIDAIPGVGVGIGTVRRQIEAGCVFRGGWNLPEDFGPARIDDLAAGPTRNVNGSGLGAYGYVRLGGRAVFHNAFIDGPDFRSGPGTTVESAPFVGEIEAGFNLRYCWDRCALDLGYAQVFNTGEFREQSGGDEWAALRVTFSFAF